MGLFNAVINGNSLDNIQEAFQDIDTTSEAMKQSQLDCYNLFYGEGDDRHDNSQKIAATIINKLVKATFSEYSHRANDDTITDLLDKIDVIKKRALQSVLLGGESFIKPIIKDNSIDFIIIDRNCFIPLGRDASGKIIKVGLSEVTVKSGKYYTLIEERTAGDYLTVRYSLYYSDVKGTLGRKVPLSSLSKYADLQEEIIIPIKDSLGLVQYKTPCLNCVDGSNDGTCIYAAAAHLIHNLNRNEMNLGDEFDLSQKRIIVSEDLFRPTEDGRRVLYDKIFTTVDRNTDDVGITEYSPEIREQSYLNYKRELLRNIENLIGLKHGLLADVSEEQKTATEITDSKGDYASTITEIEDMWTGTVRAAVELSEALSRIYNLGIHEYDVDDIFIDYGDGVLYNRDKTFNEMASMVSSGILDPVHFLGWYYEIDTSTPEGIEAAKALMPEMDRLLATE
jgi:A118 family predicted phage portal protein